MAEGLEPGMSAAMVARKHGISTGQFYARGNSCCCAARSTSERGRAECGGHRCDGERA